MAASDSLSDFVPALSGSTLMRFPTDGLLRAVFFRQIEQGLSGYLHALSSRAAALYTVPADRASPCCFATRCRLRLLEWQLLAIQGNQAIG
jgi:hypothetical protein